MRCLRARFVTGHSGGSKDQPGDTMVVPRNLVDQGLGLALAGSEVSKAPWSWQSRVERREAGRVLRDTGPRRKRGQIVELTRRPRRSHPLWGKRKRGPRVARHPFAPGGAALAARAI